MKNHDSTAGWTVELIRRKHVPSAYFAAAIITGSRLQVEQRRWMEDGSCPMNRASAVRSLFPFLLYRDRDDFIIVDPA